MYEQSHRDYLLLWLSASSSARHGLLIITVITPLPTKPSATKTERLAQNAAITDMQMRQRDVAALDAKYTKELADAKAENDALRDDACRWSSSVAHQKQSVSQCVKPPSPPAWIMQPRLADTAERDYFTLRERLITMQKQLEGNPEVY